jgi:hypothetical protein
MLRVVSASPVSRLGVLGLVPVANWPTSVPRGAPSEIDGNGVQRNGLSKDGTTPSMRLNVRVMCAASVLAVERRRDRRLHARRVGSALDSLGGGSDGAFVRAARDLEKRGDAAIALQIADLGLLRHPSSAELRKCRERALTTLREIHSQTNPFRFIVYSEWAGRGLDPVPSPDAAPATREKSP